MNKRKILILAVAVCMVAILAIGGSLAYLTDSDADVNVMATGNIRIIQNETDRNGEAFVNGQALLPAVYVGEDGKPWTPTSNTQGPATTGLQSVTGPDGNAMNVYDKSINGEIDKVISVTNKGNVEAYVRTIVLFEGNVEMSHWFHYVPQAGVRYEELQVPPFMIGDTEYFAVVFTYDDPLAAGQTTPASLKQIWLDPVADNSWYDYMGEEVTILAFSQATQTAGFANADEALNTAFGEVTVENIQAWVEVTPIKTSNLNNVVGGLAD